MHFYANLDYGLWYSIDTTLYAVVDGEYKTLHAGFYPAVLSYDNEVDSKPFGLLRQGLTGFSMHNSEQKDVFNAHSYGLVMSEAWDQTVDSYYDFGDPVFRYHCASLGQSWPWYWLRASAICPNLCSDWTYYWFVGTYQAYYLGGAMYTDERVIKRAVLSTPFGDAIGWYWVDLGHLASEPPPDPSGRSGQERFYIYDWSGTEYLPDSIKLYLTGYVDIVYRIDSDGDILDYYVTNYQQFTNTLTKTIVQTHDGELIKFDPAIIDLVDQSFERSYDWETGMAENISQVNMTTTNSISFINDLRSLPSQVSDDIDSLSKLASKSSGKLKVAAKLFLSVHYGYKLLASDAVELARVYQRYSKEYTQRVSFAVGGNLIRGKLPELEVKTLQGHCNVYYNPYEQLNSALLSFAEAVDLVPDFSNVWDMIPFSFVVDWFTNIGELAEGIDSLYTLEQQHRVIGTVYSTTERVAYKPGGFYTLGHFDLKLYRRWCIGSGHFPWPNFSFQTKNPLSNLYHWCEGASLVVATKP